MKIELLRDCRCTIGESPTWSARDGMLYWIDVKAPALFRSEPGQTVRSWPLPADIGAFALTLHSDAAVVALRTGVFLLSLTDGGLEPLAAPPFDPDHFRFNEGLCDERGRFLLGVMLDPLPGITPKPGVASLHSFTTAEALRPMADEADLHNGMAWSRDGRTLFLSHSNQGTIHRHAYDPEDGTLGLPQPFASTDAAMGLPDGAAMDEEGCYWCALHGAGLLRRHDPDGRVLLDLELPVSQPTMCTFTGDRLDELVITSARNKLPPGQLRREPLAGGMFIVRPGVRGLPRPCVVS